MRLIRLSLGQHVLVTLAAVIVAVSGAIAYRQLPIDAFPDVSPTQVVAIIRVPGLSPVELETRVTAPVELAMKGIPNLVQIRFTTRYGLALMTYDFSEGTDVYWARTQVTERLQEVEDQLPDAASGGLAPVVTPLADSLMFTIEGGDLDLTQRRFLLDWTIRPALRDVPGVADVNAMGGFVRTFEIAPVPTLMAARNISVGKLCEALERNTRSDGAGRVSRGEEALLVSVEGQVQTIQDLQEIVVVARAGEAPVRVRDIAEVRTGALARNGVVTRDGRDEAVWGTVLALRGVNARTLVESVKTRLDELRGDLPEGVSIRVFYDRGDLIDKAVWTVQKVLIEAIVLVLILLILFLGGIRAAVVVSITLPLAVLGTFGVMRIYGLSANIMSLGGMAIAIGLLVDCAVVVVENVAHRIAAAVPAPDFKARVGIVASAAGEVAVPLVSGVGIIATVFMPLLSLQGLEGKMFAPVALTIVFALCTALLLSLILVPVLCAYLLRGDGRPERHKEPFLVRWLLAVYAPALHAVIRRPVWVLIPLACSVCLAAFAFTRLGGTFMPTMDEGTTILTVRKHLTVNVDETASIDRAVQRAVMERVPEVKGVMARAGSDEIGLDPMGLGETDMYLQLAPRETWRKPDRAWLIDRIGEVVAGFPGVTYSFSQPIDMRVQEMIIGARGDVVLKIFGPDIDQLNRIASEAAAIIEAIPSSAETYTMRNEGLKYLSVVADRMVAGRFGLDLQDLQQTLKMWVDGLPIGIVTEKEARIPVVLRGHSDLQRSPANLRRLPVVLPAGGSVRLDQAAAVREIEGPYQVVREQGRRYATVLTNVRGGDLVGFVEDARAKVESGVSVPAGYRLVWGGQFENQQRASARLAVVVPIALALIFFLLYATFGSVRQAILVFCNVPCAAIGGVIALWLSGEALSVPASVGFIALLGIAVLNGVVLVSYINTLIDGGMEDRREAVLEGAKRRMTPVMLTASIAALGLVPFLFADGPGSEIQRPLAIVVIGGLVSATSLTLLLLPILFDRFAGSRRIAEAALSDPSTPMGEGI